MDRSDLFHRLLVETLDVQSPLQCRLIHCINLGIDAQDGPNDLAHAGSRSTSLVCACLHEFASHDSGDCSESYAPSRTPEMRKSDDCDADVVALLATVSRWYLYRRAVVGWVRHTFSRGPVLVLIGMCR